MCADPYKAYWELRIGRSDLVQVMDPICESFDRTERGRTCRVVHGCATLAVLLIIQVQPGGIGLAQGVQGRRVCKAVSVFEKVDVLASKLYGSFFSARGGHCVFAWMEEEEKGSRE
jgi:hypothetical protein